MTKQMVDVPTEGENTFSQGAEDNTSEVSPTENNEPNDTQSTEGEEENTQEENQESEEDTQTETTNDNSEESNVPFHEHPRWKEREDEWTQRFNDQEQRHQEDIKKIRDEIGQNSNNNQNTEVPAWFGGTKEQWSDFQKWNQGLIEQSQQKTLEKFNESKTAEDKAVKEATDYMKSEISSIEKDTALNPEGKTVDQNKLLKFVMDNDLVDSKGRWNYRAGWIMMNKTATPAKPDTKDRKKIAQATTSQPKGETKPAPFKTSEDFKTDRPW